MVLEVSQIYSVRSGTKLSLPKIIQENIAKLRISPATYRPVRLIHKPHQHYKPKPVVVESNDNWREKKLVEYVRRLKENDDPEYGQILSIFNKLSKLTLEKLTTDIITIIQKRDEQFRLRVSALLFDKAITQNAFSAIMADCAKLLSETIPEVKDDLMVQIDMFPSLYDLEKTLTFPSSSDPHFDGKIIEMFRQKEKRKGYAKFITQLYVRNMISELIIQASLTNVVDDILDLSKQARTTQLEENVTQFVDFLYETANALPEKAVQLRKIIKDSSQSILDLPRASLPSLSMRSRFRLEDVVKQTLRS